MAYFCNSSLTRRAWSFRATEWHRVEVENRGFNLIDYVSTWHLIGFMCDPIIQNCKYSLYRPRKRQLVHGTPVELLRAQTEAVEYKPTLAQSSARNSRYGIGGGYCGRCVSHRHVLSTSPSCCCCCEPKFDPALLSTEGRHDALPVDSPNTPCIRVPSPLACGRNNVRELRSQKRHVLGDGGGSSIRVASPFSYRSTIGEPAANCCLLQTPGTSTSYVVRVISA